jgi:hypothetical protein
VSSHGIRACLVRPLSAGRLGLLSLTGQSMLDGLAPTLTVCDLLIMIRGQLASFGLPRRVSRRTTATHGDASPLELLADCAPMNAQLGADLAQAPTLGIQVGSPLNVHGDTVASPSRSIDVCRCARLGIRRF